MVLFSATNAIYDPSTHGQAPLKSKDGSTILTSNADIQTGWKEHYDDLLNQNERKPTDNSHSQTPTIEEIEEAISTMKNNKAARPDDIPAEIFKYGGQMLREQLHRLLVSIWANEV